MRTTQLLAVGDVHLGRRPTHLPDDLDDHQLKSADLGPRAALGRLVEEARRRHVAAVLFAGDVVDEANRFFEAAGALDEAVRGLTRSGIEVVAVSGNHDGDVLPRLARSVEGMRLLGAGGRWESHEILVEGQSAVTIAGWSFPAESHHGDPLAGFPDAFATDGAVIGLLHADLDAGKSRYAPVSRATLETRRPDAWLLGHIHAPSDLRGDRPIGYLGSLVGLDPSETGRRGPWLIEVGPGRAVRATHLPRAPLRWESIEVDAAALTGVDGLEEAILGALGALHDRLAGDGELATTRAVGCRVVVRGRSESARSFDDPEWTARARSLRSRRDDVLYFIDRVDVDVRPAFDLERLAAHDDPPGLIAKRLLELSGGADDATIAELVARARDRMDDAARSGPWHEIGGAELDEARVRAALVSEGYRILERLLAVRTAP